MAQDIRYSLDEDTEELAEIVLTWAQQIVDLQNDEEVRADMQSMVTELADRLCIQTNIVTIEESEDELGDLNLKIHVEPTKPKKPKLTVVDNDNIVEFKKNTDDDDNPGGTVH